MQSPPQYLRAWFLVVCVVGGLPTLLSSFLYCPSCIAGDGKLKMTFLTWATLVGAMHCGSLSLLVQRWTGLVSLCIMFTGCPEVGYQRPFFWSGSLGAGSSGSSGSPLIQDRSGITAFLKQQLQVRSWVWKSVPKAPPRACLLSSTASPSASPSGSLVRCFLPEAASVGPGLCNGSLTETPTLCLCLGRGDTGRLPGWRSLTSRTLTSDM